MLMIGTTHTSSAQKISFATELSTKMGKLTLVWSFSRFGTVKIHE